LEDPLHREILEEHACAPSFKGNLETFSHSGSWLSSNTGNSCKVEIMAPDLIIKEIRFSGQGSALFQACASLMCSQVLGNSLQDTSILCQNIFKFIENGIKFSFPGELIVYNTIYRFPERHDCSLLPWRAMEKSLCD
jgi:NifU-like protein involved in Fe-S cluster formation